MSEIWLYCEGKTDPPVLRAAFSALGISNITAEATGTSPAKVASWKRQQGFLAASVSDRDYRPKADCDATFVPNGTKFYWRRHSIENYLLEPVVVTEAFQLLKSSMAEIKHPPAWVELLPTSLEAVKSDIQAAAKLLSNQECGCITLHKLWSSLGDQIGHVQCPTPSVFKEVASQTADACRRSLISSARQVATIASSWASTHLLAEENVESLYGEKLAEISKPEYIESNSFLYEFHGKRLRRSLLQVLYTEYGMNLNANLFQEELVKGFESVLIQNSNAEVAEDIRELAEIIQSTS